MKESAKIMDVEVTMDVEVAMDMKDSPMVLWYPLTKELEVRVGDMLQAAEFAAPSDDALAALEKSVHHTIKKAFEADEITTLIQARILAFNCIAKAAKRGDLVGTGAASMKALLEKQTALH